LCGIPYWVAYKESIPQDHAIFEAGLKEWEAMVGISLRDDIMAKFGNDALAYCVPVSLDDMRERLGNARTPSESLKVVAGEPFESTVYVASVADVSGLSMVMKFLTSSVVVGARQDPAGADLRELRVEEEDCRGVAIRTVYGIPGMTLRPSYAFAGGYLIMSGSPELVKSAVETASGLDQGRAQSPLVSAIRELADEAVGFVAAYDSAPALEEVFVLISQVIVPAAMEDELGYRDPSVMELLDSDWGPVFDACSKHFGTSVIAIRSDPAGISVHTRGPVPASLLCGAMPMSRLMVIGIIAEEE